MSKKTIKLFDGVSVTYKGETTNVEGPWDLWEMFNWDVENDPNAKEAAQEVTRCLFALGYCNLRANDGNVVALTVIPCKD